MTVSILQIFLDNRFIKTDEPEHITKLEKASSEIQKQLSKKKTKIISYTLVALDPTISDKDPIIGEVEALIIKQWSTFRNSVKKTRDKPIVYIQAVILDALNKLSKDENLAAIIWHTGCNIVNYYKLAGQEEVLTHFLLEIGKKVEGAGRKKWSINENIQLDSNDSIELTSPKISRGKVNERELQMHLMAASGQESVGGENPQWPSNNAVDWPRFFSERAAKGFSEEINAALTVQNNSIGSIAKYIQKAVDTYLEQVSSNVSQNSFSSSKRSDLLWWKQALYSSKLDSSYRILDPLALTIAMAVDLADSISPIYPKSVDFLLQEALFDVLNDETDKEIALVELLEQLKQLSSTENQLLDDLYNENESRKSLGACMASMMKGQMSANELFKHTGLEKKAELSLQELTVWLFHDLHANTLANTK